MITPRVTRALNPHKRRKFSLKQIRAGFGGKRRRASLKASKRHPHKRRAKAKTENPKKRRRAKAKANPRTRARVVYRTKYKTRTKKVYVAAKPKRKANAKRKRSSNPGPYLLTMSPVLGNPHKKRRKTSMAKAKRRVSAKGRSGKRRNPTRRRSVAKRNGHIRHHRNPFGETTPQLIKDGFGVFLGFSAGKKIPPMFGPGMNSSPMMTLLSTGLTAGLMAWAANSVAALRPLARGVLWGGTAAVINVAWNAWAPPSIAGYAGVGDFVSGGFPLPQGPVRYALSSAPMEAPNGSQVNVGAFGRAW